MPRPINLARFKAPLSARLGCISRKLQNPVRTEYGLIIHDPAALRRVVISDQVDSEIANHLPYLSVVRGILMLSYREAYTSRKVITTSFQVTYREY
jgi:hypothetical protein